MENPVSSKKIRFIKRIIILISLIVNIGLCIILFTPVTEIMHKIIMVSDTPRKSDVIVILSSAFPFNTERGLPGLSTLVRLERGLELYRSGYADKIIALGGIQIKRAKKTTGQLMKERLLLYGVPEEDIILHDDIRGTSEYYDNLMLMLEKYKNKVDFNRALFVTSAEHSYRIKKCLLKKLKDPIVVTSEPYELAPDWGRRFHLFRRVVNEILFAIPEFYFKGRF